MVDECCRTCAKLHRDNIVRRVAEGMERQLTYEEGGRGGLDENY